MLLLVDAVSGGTATTAGCGDATGDKAGLEADPLEVVENVRFVGVIEDAVVVVDLLVREFLRLSRPDNNPPPPYPVVAAPEL